MSKRNKAYIVLIAVILVWGLAFPITKYALNDSSPHVLVTARFLVASVVFSIILIPRFKEIDKKTIIYGSICGLLLYSFTIATSIGFSHTTSNKGGFYTQLYVLFAPFLIAFINKTKVNKYVYIAIPVSLIGILLLSYTNEGFTKLNIGDIICIFSAFLFGLHVVFTSHFQNKYKLDTLLFTLIGFYVATIASIPMTIVDVVSNGTPSFDLQTIMIILYLGALTTGFGVFGQAYALKHMNPTRVVILIPLEALIGAIGAVFIVNEPLTPYIFVGGLFIMAAVIIIEAGGLKKKVDLE